MPSFKPINKMDELPNWQDVSKFNSKEKIVTLDGRQYALIAKKQHSLATCEWITRLFLALVATLPFFIGLAFKCVRKMWAEVISGKETIRFGMLLDNRTKEATPIQDQQTPQKATCNKPAAAETSPPKSCTPIPLSINFQMVETLAFPGLINENGESQPNLTPQDFLNRYLETVGLHAKGSLKADAAKLQLNCDQKLLKHASRSDLQKWNEAMIACLLLIHPLTIEVNGSPIVLRYASTTVEETNGEVYLHFSHKNEKFRIKINNADTPNAQILLSFIKEFLPLCYLIKMDLDRHFEHPYRELKTGESVLFIPEFYYSAVKTVNDIFEEYKKNRKFNRASYKDFQKAAQDEENREHGLIFVKNSSGAVLEIGHFNMTGLHQDPATGSAKLVVNRTSISLDPKVYEELSKIRTKPTSAITLGSPIISGFFPETHPFVIFDLSSESRYLEFNTTNTLTKDWETVKEIQKSVTSTLSLRKTSFDEKENKFKKSTSTSSLLENKIAALNDVKCDKNEELLKYKSEFTALLRAQVNKLALKDDPQSEIEVIDELLLIIEKTAFPALKNYEFKSLELISDQKCEEWVNSADLSDDIVRPAVDMLIDEEQAALIIVYTSLAKKQLIVIDPIQRVLVLGISSLNKRWLFRFLSLPNDIKLNMESTTFHCSKLSGQFNIQINK